jgi:hypothetical protein
MFKIEKIGSFGIKTVKDIFAVADQIDFDPPYQRYGNLWSIEKKRLLIDSIINSYDLPKFYIHYITDNSNKINSSGKPYAIIDGKQRLQAIFEFLNNEFKLDDNFVYELDPMLYDLSDLSYKEITSKYPELKFLIDNFVLDVVFVITDEIERLEELFYRLNEGMPLNNAEKRNRVVGFINDEIRRLVATNPFLIQSVQFSGKRLQYQDLTLKLLFTEFNESLSSFDKKSLDDFVEQNKISNPKLDESIQRLESNLTMLSEIFQPGDYLLKSRAIIPVYYYFITRDKPKLDKLRDFLDQFESIRKQNRKKKDYNPILVEFDRQNQQGVHRQKSLKLRHELLEKYYIKFLEDNLTVDTLVNIDMKENDFEN